MNFNKHSDIAGRGLHAFLSGSKYHWINYDVEKIISTYLNYQAVQRGVELHEFAKICIELRRKQPKNKDPLNMYINDAIGFGMTPEQMLFYSSNAFGTADAISFNDNFLRIHDLKTGESRVSICQLEVYAALFCLEYGFDPRKIKMELRIYQTENILVDSPSPDIILEIMEKTILFDKEIDKLKEV